MRPVGSVGREVRPGRDEEASLFRPFGEGRGVLAGVDPQSRAAVDGRPRPAGQVLVEEPLGDGSGDGEHRCAFAPRLVRAFEQADGDQLVDDRGAQVDGLARLEKGPHPRTGRPDPPHADPAPEELRQAPDRDEPVVREKSHKGLARAAVGGEVVGAAVLDGEGGAAGEHRGEPVAPGRVRRETGGVVDAGLKIGQHRLLRQGLLEQGQVDAMPFEGHAPHPGPSRPQGLQRAAIAGVLDDHLVAGGQIGADHQRCRMLGATGHHDLVRGRRHPVLAQPLRDGGPQGGEPRREVAVGGQVVVEGVEADLPHHLAGHHRGRKSAGRQVDSSAGLVGEGEQAPGQVRARGAQLGADPRARSRPGQQPSPLLEQLVGARDGAARDAQLPGELALGGQGRARRDHVRVDEFGDPVRERREQRAPAVMPGSQHRRQLRGGTTDDCHGSSLLPVMIRERTNCSQPAHCRDGFRP